ncbi:tautomerase family protein [uncultured Vagococcus sp.]|uniref:tautomerase family protein n=1 Tax=uncultured Vagococcus sp. TaxID=189676 RepID=UPI0028CFF2F5|nr:tautomerase family protein [uncultured Vagococcus sp.]
MPMIHFDVYRGRTPAEISQLLEVAHKVFVEVLEIPEGDRYQVVHQHEPYEMVIQDTGLGFTRSQQVVVMSIFSKERREDQKQRLYRELVEALETRCGIAPNDVMMSFFINGDADWSFGFGRAQFLTGELT